MIVTERVSGRAQSPSEKARVHEVLTAERDGTVGYIAALTRDWDSIVESCALVAVDDEHDPEGATIAFERAQIDALLIRARSHLTDLDRALERLDEGTYGMCGRCKRSIAVERLAARPASTTCIRCAATPTER
jgi:RNA polymerase-binding transcription factor DksA